MSLSKLRNAARMRNNRALAKGVQPSATQLVEVLSPNQRKERLASLILTPIPSDKVSAAHVISAIDVYNKMERIYEDRTPTGVTVVNSFTFILPDGTKVSPKQLKEGSHAIQRQEQAKGVQSGEDAQDQGG